MNATAVYNHIIPIHYRFMCTVRMYVISHNIVYVHMH